MILVSSVFLSLWSSFYLFFCCLTFEGKVCRFDTSCWNWLMFLDFEYI